MNENSWPHYKANLEGLEKLLAYFYLEGLIISEDR
jgi:hypothetical protein